MIQRIKPFIMQCRRVLLVATKPDKTNFKLSMKITGIGIIIIGAIGFIIFLAVQLIGGL